MTTSTYKLRRKWKTAAVSLAVGGLVVGAAGAVLQIIASSDPAVGLQCFPNPDRTDNMHGNYTCNGDYYKADYASLDKRLETRHISQIAAIGAFVLGPSALIAAVGILYFGPRDPVFVPVASHDTVGFAFEKRF